MAEAWRPGRLEHVQPGCGGQGHRRAWPLPPSGMQEAAALEGGRGEAGRPGFLGGGGSGFCQAGGRWLVVRGWILRVLRSRGQRDRPWTGRGLGAGVCPGGHLAAAQPTCGNAPEHWVTRAARGRGRGRRELTALLTDHRRSSRLPRGSVSVHGSKGLGLGGPPPRAAS